MTGTDAALPAWSVVPGWVRWAHSARDGLAHAFPADDSQQGRWPRAVCSYTVPPAALGPATVVSPRCARCALAVTTTGTTRRHRRDRPGARARLLAWLRDHRHDPQPPQAAQEPDIRLPPTTVETARRDGRNPGTAGPGRATAPGRVLPPPDHRNPGVAR